MRLTLIGRDRQQPQTLEFPLPWPYSLLTSQRVLILDLATAQLSAAIFPVGKQPRLDFSGVVLQGQNRATGFWVDPAGVGLMDIEALGAPEPAPVPSSRAAP